MAATPAPRAPLGGVARAQLFAGSSPRPPGAGNSSRPVGLLRRSAKGVK